MVSAVTVVPVFFSLSPPPPSPTLSPPHVVVHVQGLCINSLWLIPSPSFIQSPPNSLLKRIKEQQGECRQRKICIRNTEMCLGRTKNKIYKMLCSPAHSEVTSTLVLKFLATSKKKETRSPTSIMIFIRLKYKIVLEKSLALQRDIFFISPYRNGCSCSFVSHVI